MKGSAMESGIKRFLESPLADALASDVAIMGGLEILRSMMRAKRLSGTLPNQGATVLTTPPPPKELHKALVELTTEEIQEVTTWINTLQHTHKLELSKWGLDELKKLFKLPAETRTQLITTITGPTLVDEYKKLTQWMTNRYPHLNDRSKAIIQEWEEWARNLNRAD